METNGTCNHAFEAVREAFVANFDAGDELGASVAVTVDGEFVVDLWAGDADQHGRPWVEDTIVNVFSSTKTMASLCVLMLADRGKLDLDAPVATYWPEFAQNSKGGVLVRHVMAHSAGLPGFDPPLEIADLYDWKKVCDNLAAQAPWWEPGTAVGYHALTQGYLQGELVRRVDGRTLGTFFREEVAEPLGADFHIGLDAKHDHRVADLVPPIHLPQEAYGAVAPGSVAERMAKGGRWRMRRSRQRGRGAQPRSRPSTVRATPVRWPSSTPSSPAAARSATSACFRKRHSRGFPKCRSRATI